MVDRSSRIDQLVVLVVSIFAFGSLPTGAPPKPGTYTPVPLIVTMNACTLGLAEICGDEGSDNATSTDVQDGVRASTDQYGNVIIDFQTTRAKIRGLVYKYGVGSTSAPPGGGSNHYFSTIAGALQAIDPIGASIFVDSCPLYDDDSGQPQYRHGFSRDCQSGFACVGSSQLMVTRTSEITWEIQPSR